MSRKLTPGEAAQAREDARQTAAARIDFVAGLEQAAKGYETGRHNRECAAIAVAATIAYILRICPPEQRHLLAPLDDALEIIEAGIDPASLPDCRMRQAVVSYVEAYPGKPLPPIDSFKKRKLPKAVMDKILGSVAVECQLLHKVSLDQALRNVAGQDSRARQRLKDFRYNMKEKNSPKGAREEFDNLMKSVPFFPRAAQMFLDSYRQAQAKKS